MRTKLLIAVAIALVAAGIGYSAAPTAPDPNEPVVVTRAMYAELLCMFASDYDAYKGGFSATYGTTGDTIRVIFHGPCRQEATPNPAQALVLCKARNKELAAMHMNAILRMFQKHVNPRAQVEYIGF